ncbi:MAG TPA: gamma-glutamyltransferase [Gemmataceae bacterium]|nr:gamma-glutamyltransferase [Gemmataceae bacterium]
MPGCAANYRRGVGRRARALLVTALTFVLGGGMAPLAAAAKPVPSEKHGIVVAVSPPGADTGRDILLKGGNAVDAAVATAFAMAVTYPAAGNIGGGGFMLIHPAGGKGAPVVIDYREKAPRAAHKTMFTKDDSWYSAKAVGVPGTVRGLALAHAKFCTLPWKELVMPAVKLAEEGFVIDAALAGSLNWIVGSSPEFPELRRVFGKPGGGEWKAGDRLVQKDLARTLRLIADKGPDGFYKGAVAEMLAAEMKRNGGLITTEDLAAYEAKARTPIHGTYRSYDVYGPPPPSSGGTCLVEMLNILENFDLRKQGRFSPETLHIMIETMRRAYCDRARYLGDTDFVKVPAFLTSKEHARKLAQSIDLHKATRSEDLAKDIPLKGEGDSTTHFSVIDSDGMAVSNTYTLERSYGSRIVVKGAGFVLNNEMMDFNWFPGETTRNGGIGTEPNQVAPGKRMLSSQTPTIVAKNGKVVLVTGSPGSRTIINTVLCMIVNVIDFDMDLQAAVDAPRLHHPWFPDTARFEGTRKYAEAVKRLEAMGHSISGTRQGDAHSIGLDRKTGKYIGAADHRIDGKVSGF